MKPDRDEAGESDNVGDLECETQSGEFFAQVGMLIVEGRIPQYSDKGRAEGPHCVTLFRLFSHVCDPGVDSSCQDMLEKKQKMTQLWQNGSPMIITVFVRTPNRELILLERWKVEGVDKAIVPNGICISGSVLLQAVRSHIHFSQLSAWLSRSKGSIPCETIYRVCEPGEHSSCDRFLKEPDYHVFPLTHLQSDLALRVQVESLPRCEIFSFTDEILESKLTHLGANCLLKDNEKVKEISESSSNTTDDLFRSPLKKKTCLKDIETQHLNTSNGNNFTARHKMCSVDILKSSSNKSLVEEMLALQTNVKSYKEHLGSQISSQENCKTNLMSKRTITPGIKVLEKQGQLNQHSNINTKLQAKSSLESKKRNVDQKRIEGAACYQNYSSDSSISKDITSCRQSLLARRHVRTGTIPIFNSSTGLPVSSSPAPLRRSATDLHLEDDSSEVINGCPGRSSYKDLTALISRSAPASTTQSLLGNFEESVLNGRMEPLGTVEGFTSELGASGSFCPAHVTLPVRAYFFSLSDDNAPSPYLGYISLEESASISSKGYHVPTRGTVQLTLFNPNKTVVKMFVVLYDFSDMPPKAQTFLRQRTFSVWGDSCQSCEVQTSLHYLIHLRFTSSKSGRLYLHTDIRVIFPRHPPDLPSGYKLCTVTDGPTEPRYTLQHKLV